MTLLVYTNADWVGSASEKRSISGYCMFLEWNLVTWRHKKQFMVVRLNAEAKFQHWRMGHVSFS